MAVHHSPDLMIAGRDAAGGGPRTWVLGEIHPSIVTTRYATWMAFSDDPEARDHYGPYTQGFVSVPYGDLAAVEAAMPGVLDEVRRRQR